MSLMPMVTGNDYSDMSPIQIYSEGILQLLLDLELNKVPGSDAIPAQGIS